MKKHVRKLALAAMGLVGFAGWNSAYAAEWTAPAQGARANVVAEMMQLGQWKPVWDGKTFDGWHIIGKGQWTIEDGAIIGRHPASEAEFGHLVSNAKVRDFAIRLHYKAIKGNSGLYFRIEESGASGVSGFQAEIDAAKDAGGLYETNGRSWVVQPKPEDVKKYFKPGEWNEMVVVAFGGNISVFVNGVESAELVNDPSRREGNLALQVHAGQDCEMMFKDIEMLQGADLVGADLSAWRQPTHDWKIVADTAKDSADEHKLSAKDGTGAMYNGAKGFTGNIFSQQEYCDVAAHVEFMVPKGSNSGVYFMGRYEIQVFDSFGKANPDYSDCGGIYQRWIDNPQPGQEQGYEGRSPKVNASLPPGEWQSYDVIFRGPRFDPQGKKTANAMFVKVIHNGKLIHENQEVTGPTRAAAFNDEKPTGPLMLQGDHGPVAYRNVRIAPLNGDTAKLMMMADQSYEHILGYKFGDNRTELSKIENEIRDAKPEQYGDIEGKLIATLQSPNASEQCKAFCCRMLARVGSGKCVPAVAPLLGDPKLSYMARYALEPNADPAAGEALRKSLDTLKGEMLIGAIGSIAQRHDASAVPALAKFAGDSDAAVARAAIESLGDLGTVEAAKALESAKGPAEQIASARIVCADRLRAAGKNAEAAAIYGSLQGSQTPVIALASLRGMVASLPRDQAVDLAVKSLQGEDLTRQAAIVAALRDTTDAAFRDAVLAKMPEMKPAVQGMVLGALIDIIDARMKPALARIAQDSPDEQLRVSAIGAFGRFAEGSDLTMLGGIAAKDAGAESAAARRAIEQVAGKEIDAEVIRLTETGDVKVRQVMVRAIANRNMDLAAPQLIKLLSDSEASVAGVAAQTLGEKGDVPQLPPLVKATVDAGTPALRGACENALRTICGRLADKAACAQAVLPALQQTQNAEARAALLRVLPRIGDDASLKAVTAAMKDPTESVADAATRALADWNEINAAPALLEVAKTSQHPAYPVLALRSYIRIAATCKQAPADDRADMLKQALEIAKRADEKRQAISAAAELPSLKALELVRERLNDADLKVEAQLATARMAKAFANTYNARMMKVLEELKPVAANDDVRKQVDEAMDLVRKGADTKGWIQAWLVSGMYAEEGKNCQQLFDVAFAPEKNDKTAWQVLPAFRDRNRPFMLSMQQLFGEQADKVVYLKTRIISDKAQDAVIEIGSDDGYKVWLNGQQVAALNVTRAFGPASEKFKVSLKQGENPLLVKLTQNNGGWEAALRLRAPQGGDVQGVTFSAE